MGALDDWVRDSDGGPREFAASVTGSGGWAKVAAIASGQITGTIDDFDGGYQTFGPVPVADLTGDGVTAGDRVWLLVDSTGEPGAALKF